MADAQLSPPLVLPETSNSLATNRPALLHRSPKLLQQNEQIYAPGFRIEVPGNE